MQLAAMIKKARKAKDVSLHLAAIESGVPATMLHYLETGKTIHPKMDVVRKISDYFALPYDDVCIAAQRIPEDVFYKIIDNPKILPFIREFAA